jgi:GT2 family glycosyltransferase
LQKAKEGLEAEIQSHASLVAELRETIETLEAENRAWSARWQDLEAGIGWQLLHRLRLLRLRYLPRGSRRERWMKATFAGLRKIQTEGFRRGLARGLSSMVAKAREKRRPGRGRAIPPALAQVIQIAPVAVRGSVPVHREPVDIVICVHNALEDVRACLNSLLENTEGPYTIVLVDDGSEEETASFLRFFAQANDARLIRNEKALGYTRAANIGMSAREGEFVVLLNSDTIVTPGWLDRLIACANSGPRIGVVGPLSNTASWQSIPEIEQGGDWAPNPIPPGYSVEDVGRLVARYSAQLYPWMPFLNGFCLLIRRELLDEIGGFDEEHFGQGYGEEDDFVLRARKAGWCLALADDAYVYHAQSRSYTTEGRRQRYEVSGRMLRQLHGEEIIREGVQYCLKDRVLEGIRARSRVMFGRQDWIRRGRRRFDSARVLFVLPIMTPGGGGNVIIQESRAMSEMGVEVAFFNLNRYEQGFQRAYPSLEIPCFFGEIEELPDIARGFDAVVATYNPSVAWLGSIERKQGKPCIGYYIQGFEPLMYPEGSADYQVALDSYTAVEGLKRFVKTRWTRNQILTNIGVDSEVVGVSVDIDLFRPRPRAEDEWPSRPLRVAAMVRPASPYRSPFLTLELLHLAHAHFGGDVEFVLFGSEPRDPEFLQLTEGLPCKVAGVLTREQMANLMNQVDVFVDFSQHQAMGLSALEAMACGVAVIVPANGGAVAYARHAVNSFVVDTSSKEACWMALRRIIEDHELRSTIQQRALRDVVAYYPEKVAYRILEVLLEKESNAQ